MTEPTESGFYWVRWAPAPGAKLLDWEVASVFEGVGGLKFVTCGSEEISLVEPGFIWGDRIAPPL